MYAYNSLRKSPSTAIKFAIHERLCKCRYDMENQYVVANIKYTTQLLDTSPCATVYMFFFDQKKNAKYCAILGLVAFEELTCYLQTVLGGEEGRGLKLTTK